MADSNVIPAFITIISFLGIVVLLISWIPTDFFAVSEEMREVSVPDEFEAIDVQYYADDWSYTLNETGGEIKVQEYKYAHSDFGGYKIDFNYYKANQSEHWLWINHVESWWIFVTNIHNMEWKNTQGTDVTQDFWGIPDRGISADVIDTYLEDGQAEFLVYCNHFSFHVFFGYNTTAYNNCSDAWDHHALYTYWGIHFDQQNTGYSAWDIVAMLLFFQLPDTHWMINAIIAVPIWASVALLSALLILEFIKSLPFT